MGHYDDCYEADRIRNEKETRKSCIKGIEEGMKTLDTSQLVKLYDLVAHFEDFEGFLNTIERVSKLGS